MKTALPEYLFVSSTDGALFDTRMVDWSHHPIRPVYRQTFSDIRTSLQLRATIRAGGYAWPGGYPLYLITDDCDSLCFACAESEYYQCAYSIRHNMWDGWRILGCDINYEDGNMFCCHCNKQIPSAYGNDEPEGDES